MTVLRRHTNNITVNCFLTLTCFHRFSCLQTLEISYV